MYNETWGLVHITVISKKMKRTILDFNIFSEEEQDWYLSETWCSVCKKPDLGIIEPLYYSEEDKNYIEGKCKICNTTTRTQITVTEIDENDYTQ